MKRIIIAGFIAVLLNGYVVTTLYALENSNVPKVDFMNKNGTLIVDGTLGKTIDGGKKISMNIFNRGYADAVLSVYDKSGNVVGEPIVISGAGTETNIVDYSVKSAGRLLEGIVSPYPFSDKRYPTDMVRKNPINGLFIPDGGKLIVTKNSNYAIGVNILKLFNDIIAEIPLFEGMGNNIYKKIPQKVVIAFTEEFLKSSIYQKLEAGEKLTITNEDLISVGEILINVYSDPSNLDGRKLPNIKDVLEKFTKNAAKINPLTKIPLVVYIEGVISEIIKYNNDSDIIASNKINQYGLIFGDINLSNSKMDSGVITKSGDSENNIQTNNPSPPKIDLLKYHSSFQYLNDGKSDNWIPANSGKSDNHINLAGKTTNKISYETHYINYDQFQKSQFENNFNVKTVLPSGGFSGSWYSIPYGKGNDVWTFDADKKTFSLLGYGTDSTLMTSLSGTYVLDSSVYPNQSRLNITQVNKDENDKFSIGDTLYGIYQYDDTNKFFTVQEQKNGQKLKFFTGEKVVLIRTAPNASSIPIEGSWRAIHPGDSERIVSLTLGNGYAELYFTDLSGYIHSGVSGIPTYSVENGQQTIEIKVTSVFGDVPGHVGDTVYGIYQKNGNDLSFAIDVNSRPSNFVYIVDGMSGFAVSNMVPSSEIGYYPDFMQKNVGSIVGVEESDDLSLWSQTGLIFGDNNNQTIKNNDTVVLNIYGKQVSSKAIVDSGYQYSAWGEWNAVLPSPSPSAGYWVAGKAPDIDVLAARKGKASYSGNVIGDYSKLPATIMHGAITGGIQLTADFDQQTISGNMSLNNNGVAYANPYFNATKMTTVEGDQAAFSAPLNEKSGGNGSINGCLYGPMGQETGGQFQYNHTDGSRANGIFRAKE